MTNSDANRRTVSYLPRVARRALAEMAYLVSDGQFGRKIPASKPAQLRFTETESQDTERFHDALEDVGFAAMGHEPDRKAVGGKSYYDGEVYIPDGHKKIRVFVNRNGVRIYPREDEPTFSELYRLLDALRRGFDAPLEHDPIDPTEIEQ